MKIWVFLFLSYFYSLGQTQLAKNVDQFIGVDIYENIYYLQNGSLFKSNLKNDYQNIEYGTPDSVDISNPLQIVLLYQFFNKVILLDNQLNFIASYNIPFGTKLIASAGKDKIWTYNNIHTTLSVYNLTSEKNEINAIPIVNDILKLKGNLNQALVFNNQKELITFNYLAQKINTQSLENCIYPISLHPPYYIKNTHLWNNDILVKKKLPSIKSFEVINNKLYYLQENAIYSISIPKN